MILNVKEMCKKILINILFTCAHLFISFPDLILVAQCQLWPAGKNNDASMMTKRSSRSASSTPRRNPGNEPRGSFSCPFLLRFAKVK